MSRLRSTDPDIGDPMHIRFLPSEVAPASYMLECVLGGQSEAVGSLVAADALALKHYNDRKCLAGCSDPHLCVWANALAEVCPIGADGPVPHWEQQSARGDVLARLLDLDADRFPLTISHTEIRAKVASAAAEVSDDTMEDSVRIERSLAELTDLADWCASHNATIRVDQLPELPKPRADEFKEEDGWW